MEDREFKVEMLVKGFTANEFLTGVRDRIFRDAPEATKVTNFTSKKIKN